MMPLPTVFAWVFIALGFLAPSPASIAFFCFSILLSVLGIIETTHRN